MLAQETGSGCRASLARLRKKLRQTDLGVISEGVVLNAATSYTHLGAFASEIASAVFLVLCLSRSLSQPHLRSPDQIPAST